MAKKVSRLISGPKADITNWRIAPYSRWAFHQVNEIIASAAVENDPDNVSALLYAPKQLRSFMLKQLFLKKTGTDAIVVLHKGQIVYESYANGNDEHTPHILMSATKSVVGLVAGILGDRGEIDLDAPVSAYIPEIAETAYTGVTIRQLLDMRSGVVPDESQQAAYNAATNWEPISGGETSPGLNGGETSLGLNGVETPPGLHSFFTHLKAGRTTPGGPFRYVSANTDLLGWVMERATGRTFAALLSELLWKPMGAEREAYITVDRAGAPRCTGGLCATARDFARIGQLLIDDGQRGLNEVLPKSLIDDLSNNGDHEAWAKGEWGAAFAPISKNMRYRSGWYVIDEKPKILFAMGIHGQNLFVDQANKIVVAKFSSWRKATDYVALPLTHMAVGKIRRCLGRR